MKVRQTCGTDLKCVTPKPSNPGVSATSELRTPYWRRVKTHVNATSSKHVGGCPNYGPFLGLWCNTAPSIQGTQKGTITLTTTHVPVGILLAYAFAVHRGDFAV